MLKWIVVAAILLGLMGALALQLSSTTKPPVVAKVEIDAAVPQEPADAAPFKRPTRHSSDAGGEETEIMDKESEAFGHQLDVRIPDRFRASLAKCEREGFDPDAKIKISYKLHIEGGVVSASNVQVVESDLGDRELENCMVSSIQQARWSAANYPDFSEEQDVFIRIRSLNKYLSKEEQEAAKARENLGTEKAPEAEDTAGAE